MQCPLDYSLCRQTVTVYRLEKDRVRRQVLRGVYYHCTQLQQTDAVGSLDSAACLLILPGGGDIRPGDRVYPGIGPESVQWTELLPALVPGLCQLSRVKPCFWEDILCHMEAS